MKAKFSKSEDMIKGLLSKDKEALEILCKRYGDEIYGFISNVIADHDDRVLILHKVIINIWETVDKFNPENERFFTWMMKVVRRNIAIECKTPALLEISNIGSTDQSDLLGIIDPGDYPIFYKVFFFGSPVEEIGKEFSMRPTEVRKSLYNAISDLRSYFTQSLNQ